MYNDGTFRGRINLIAITVALVIVVSLLSGALLVLRYHRVTTEVRERDLAELKTWANAIDEAARLHTEFVSLVAQAREVRDEQAIYLKGRAFTHGFDALARAVGQLAEQTLATSAISDQERARVARIQSELKAYRDSSLTAIEMLTVNPALSDQYLVTSALSLNRLNQSLTAFFDAKSLSLDKRLRKRLEEAERDALLTGLGVVLLSGIFFALIQKLTRHLRGNFIEIRRTLDGLLAGQTSNAIAQSVDQGEFARVLAGLEQFRVTLNERSLSQQKMQAIFDSVLEGVVVIDAHGRMIQTNPAACRMFGYSSDEMLGQNVNMLMPAEHVHHHDQYLNHHLSTGEERIIGNVRVMQGQARDGSPIDLRLAVSRLQVGDEIWFIGVIIDMREQIAYERSLRLARDQAMEAARLKSDFLANVSHEIRTPLNGIIGMAQMLDNETLSRTDRENYVRLLIESSRTLLTLINDVLDLSKVEAGKIELQPQDFPPLQLLRDTALLFADTAQGKGLTLQTSSTLCAADRYLADPVRVRQMLSNLVSNAIKFTLAGEVRLEVTEIEHTPSGALLEFSVTDTGIGINATDQALLFKRFSQVDATQTRQFGGTGLGLAIVLNLARLMGGDAGVSSEPGRGSRFWFRIRAPKLVAASPSPLQQSPQRPQNTPISGDLTGRVLVAEDNVINQVFIEAALAKLGVAVSVVSDGRQAVETIALGEHFDAILMDIQMPVMDGWEATRQIRRWESAHGRASCPIIAVTANAYEESRQRCKEGGMEGFIAKPILLADLRQVLAQYLQAA